MGTRRGTRPVGKGRCHLIPCFLRGGLRRQATLATTEASTSATSTRRRGTGGNWPAHRRPLRPTCSEGEERATSLLLTLGGLETGDVAHRSAALRSPARPAVEERRAPPRGRRGRRPLAPSGGGGHGSGRTCWRRAPPASAPRMRRSASRSADGSTAVNASSASDRCAALAEHVAEHLSGGADVGAWVPPGNTDDHRRARAVCPVARIASRRAASGV